MKFFIIFLVIIGLAVGSLYFFTSDLFLEWLGQRKIEKFRQEIIEIHKQDTYGGKTPYETFDMFLADLEQGDIEKASKYFISKKRSEWREKLLNMQNQGNLENQIIEWKEARETFEEVRDDYNNWETHATVRYSTIIEEGFYKILPGGENNEGIKVYIEPGEYGNDIIFDFNEYSEIWKITLL